MGPRTHGLWLGSSEVARALHGLTIIFPWKGRVCIRRPTDLQPFLTIGAAKLSWRHLHGDRDLQAAISKQTALVARHSAWICAPQFGASFVCCERPVDTGVSFVSLPLPCCDLVSKAFWIVDPAAEHSISISTMLSQLGCFGVLWN